MSLFLRDRVVGRTGEFTVDVIDRDTSDEIITSKPELVGDVVIRYGKTERSAAKQILKSAVQLSYLDPGLVVHDRVKGGFPQDRFLIRIEGPRVSWIGLLKEEERTIPFDGRVKKERTVLNCYGGIVASRIEKPTGIFGEKDALNIREVPEQVVIANIEGDQILLRHDNTLIREQEPNTEYDAVGENPTRPINNFLGGSVYDNFKSYCKTTKALLYRQLSKSAIVFDSLVLHGSSGTFLSAEEFQSIIDPFDFFDDPDYTDVSRSSLINDVEEFLIGRSEDGLKNLEKVSTIVIKLDKEQNLANVGAVDRTDNSRAIFRTQTSIAGVTYRRTDLNQPVIAQVGRDGNQGNIEFFTGEFKPQTDTALVVTWDQSEVSGSPKVELEYRGNDGSTFSVNDASTTSILEGTLTKKLIDPIIRITGTNAEVKFKVRFVNSRDKIIEELVSKPDNQGVEEIEIDDVNPILIAPNTFGDGLREAFKIKSNELGIEHRLPFFYQAELERKVRPFGTKTARGRLFGIFGPEFAHRVEERGETMIFVPTGLSINLNTGITDFSGIEVPEHTSLA